MTVQFLAHINALTHRLGEPDGLGGACVVSPATARDTCTGTRPCTCGGARRLVGPLLLDRRMSVDGCARRQTARTRVRIPDVEEPALRMNGNRLYSCTITTMQIELCFLLHSLQSANPLTWL